MEDNTPVHLGPYAALRIGDYRCLLGAGVLTAVGQTSQTAAVAWEMYQNTGSAMMLGLTGLAQFIPVLLLALPAGQAADRHSRKLIYQGAQLLGVMTSVALAVISILRGSPWLMLGCLVVVGVVRAFLAPARASLLPQVVPLPLVPNAVTWNTTGWQFASISGPALGGFLVYFAPWVAYLTTATLSLASLLLLIPIRPKVLTVRRPGGNMFAGLVEGVRFVWRTEMMLAAITLDLFAVLLGGATALLPIFAARIIDIGPLDPELAYGLLRAAPAVGALLMAITLAHLPPLRRPGVAMLLAVAAFGAATVGFGLSTSFLLSFSTLLLTGAFDNISVVVRHTLMQVLTPDEMRGRVAAVNTVFISSSNELGEFESGLTASWLGPVWAVVVGGTGTMVVVLIASMRWPRLLTLGPLHTLKPVGEPITPLSPLAREEAEDERIAEAPIQAQADGAAKYTMQRKDENT